jgi:hypothetical protein
MTLFGPPKVEKLLAKRDVDGLCKALGYKDASVRSPPPRHQVVFAMPRLLSRSVPH